MSHVTEYIRTMENVCAPNFMEGESFVDNDDIEEVKRYNEQHWIDYIQGEYAYLCPSISLVMKWLREVHNLFIVIDRHYFVVDRISHIASGFKYSIEIKTINTIYIHTDYKSYEYACEAAIKYCLENLI